MWATQRLHIDTVLDFRDRSAILPYSSISRIGIAMMTKSNLELPPETNTGTARTIDESVINLLVAYKPLSNKTIVANVILKIF